MAHITALLSADHRRADQYFDAAICAAKASDWVASEKQLSSFLEALKQRIEVEEDVLFPAFEEATGMHGGPTVGMRREHRQMHALLDRIGAAIAARDMHALYPSAESFAKLMVAHSVNEEKILYPMCDQVFGESVEETLRNALSELEPSG